METLGVSWPLMAAWLVAALRRGNSVRYRELMARQPHVSRHASASSDSPVLARILHDRAKRDSALARAWAACSNASAPSEIDEGIARICHHYFQDDEDPTDPFAMERVLARMIEISRMIPKALDGHRFWLEYELRVRRKCHVKDGILSMTSPSEDRRRLNVDDDLSRLIENAGRLFLFRRCAYDKCKRILARRGRQEYCVGCKDKAQVDRRAEDPRHKKQHMKRVNRYRAK